VTLVDRSTRPRAGRGAALLALALAVLSAGCTSNSEGAPPSDPPVTEFDAAPETLEVHAGARQIWLQDEPDASYELRDAQGRVVETVTVGGDGRAQPNASRRADERGALVLRYLDPGAGYVVRRTDGSAQSKPVTVTAADDAPPAELYEDQDLEPGYQYLTTRDGTKLSAFVTLPGPVEDGPYPTVIEYSGYEPSSPNLAITSVSKLLAAQLGFATVGVNLRGSGCSGGSFAIFEEAQAVDGYDVVETVAAQDWVKGSKVGLVGVSYPAIMSLYTASTRPPSLAAIAPMAPQEDAFRSVLRPGGITNVGYAKEWAVGREAEAANPSPMPWVQERIAGGDATCEENLELRGQNQPFASLIDAVPYYPVDEGVGDQLAPRTMVDQIDVPTFVVMSWQDEQVGTHTPSMLAQLQPEDRYVTLMNGSHADGVANFSVLQRWLEFLQLFVAEEVPDTTALWGIAATVGGTVVHDAEAVADQAPLPERFAGDSYDEALERYRAQDRVRVLVDVGGGARSAPGLAVADLEVGFDEYPVAEVEPERWYLGPDGVLSPSPPADEAGEPEADAYVSDPSVRPAGSLPQGDPWGRDPAYDWAPPVAGKALVYETPAFETDALLVGSASVDLWLRSDAADTDLQVTLSEIRPDGEEVYIQTGWLRASQRALDEELSTALDPVPTQLEADAAPLEPDAFTEVRVGTNHVGHAVRAGSKVRLTITAPGGDRPAWKFDALEGTPRNEVARSAEHPSSVLLPIVPGTDLPDALPACPGLRGNPCRPALPFANEPA
jgi:predicted acyl esterase